MKLRIVDIQDHTTEETWGTCELCEYTGDFTSALVTVENVRTGEKEIIDNEGYEQWYGPITEWEIYDWVKFAEFLGSKEWYGSQSIETLFLKAVHEWEEMEDDHQYAKN